MNIAKSILLLGSGGTLATGAYLTSGYWMPSSSEKIETPIKKSISQVLIDNKYTPLDSSKIDHWSSVLTKYNQVNSSSQKQEDQLKGDCRVLLDKKDFNDGDYKEARRWCVAPQSVSDRLTLFKRKSLSTDDTTSDESWKSKITSHGQATKNKLAYSFTTTESTNLSGIKSECKTLNARTNDSEDFEIDFSKSFEWCSVDSLNL